MLPTPTPRNSVAIGVSGEMAMSSTGEGKQLIPSAPSFRILVQVNSVVVGPLQQTINGTVANYIAQG
jgi:hypothetical protein